MSFRVYLKNGEEVKVNGKYYLLYIFQPSRDRSLVLKIMFTVPQVGTPVMGHPILLRGSCNSLHRKTPQREKKTRNLYILESVLHGIIVPATSATVQCLTRAFSLPPYIRKFATSINYAPSATWSTETEYPIYQDGKNVQTGSTSIDCSILISRKNSKLSLLRTFEIVGISVIMHSQPFTYLMTVPDNIRDVLISRYEYVVAEKEVIPDLTDNLRLCDTCNDWCPT